MCALAGMLAASCASIDTQDQFRAGVAASVFPGAGLSISGGQVVHETARTVWTAEIEATSQPLSDEHFIGPGPGHTGRFFQIRMYAKGVLDPEAEEAWTARGGVVFFRAQGLPDFVSYDGPYQENDYNGLFVGFGRAYRITDSLTVEPELAILAMHDQGGLVHYFDLADASVFTQAFVHLNWTF